MCSSGTEASLLGPFSLSLVSPGFPFLPCCSQEVFAIELFVVGTWQCSSVEVAAGHDGGICVAGNLRRRPYEVSLMDRSGGR